MNALTTGRIVQYRLSQDDAQNVNSRRHDFLAYQRETKPPLNPGGRGRTGHVGHWGNAVRSGEEFPAMIVKVWPDHPDGLVNLQVYLDGNDVLWATSRSEGDEDGHWHWPERVVADPDITVSTATNPVAHLSDKDMRALVARIQEALLKQARRNTRTMGLPQKKNTGDSESG